MPCPLNSAASVFCPSGNINASSAPSKKKRRAPKRRNAKPEAKTRSPKHARAHAAISTATPQAAASAPRAMKKNANARQPRHATPTKKTRRRTRKKTFLENKATPAGAAPTPSARTAHRKKRSEAAKTETQRRRPRQQKKNTGRAPPAHRPQPRPATATLSAARAAPRHHRGSAPGTENTSQTPAPQGARKRAKKTHARPAPAEHRNAKKHGHVFSRPGGQTDQNTIMFFSGNPLAGDLKTRPCFFASRRASRPKHDHVFSRGPAHQRRQTRARKPTQKGAPRTNQKTRPKPSTTRAAQAPTPRPRTSHQPPEQPNPQNPAQTQQPKKQTQQPKTQTQKHKPGKTDFLKKKSACGAFSPRMRPPGAKRFFFKRARAAPVGVSAADETPRGQTVFFETRAPPPPAFQPRMRPQGAKRVFFNARAAAAHLKKLRRPPTAKNEKTQMFFQAQRHKNANAPHKKFKFFFKRLL